MEKILKLKNIVGNLSHNDLEAANYANDYLNGMATKKETLNKIKERKRELRKSLDLIENFIDSLSSQTGGIPVFPTRI